MGEPVAAIPVDAIVCFSTDAWGDMKRPGQLMLKLMAHAQIIYVEPMLSLTSVVKNWRRAFRPDARKRLARAVTGRVDEVMPGVHAVTPIIAVPSQRVSFMLTPWLLNRLITRQEKRMVRRAFRAARRLGVCRPLLWASFPMRFDGWPTNERGTVVYDCMDRWSDFPDALEDPVLGARGAQDERDLARTADVVFCSAEGLYDVQRTRTEAPVLLVRNGADIDHFAPAGRPVPGDIAHLCRPVIGYVGALAEWVDFEMLRDVALLRPDWSILLIGPIFQGKTMGDARALDLVSGLPHVHLLGSRAYRDVPAYLEAFDVATIPFKLNGLTEDTNPIKVYEYLAAGVGVVSTPLAEVVSLGEARIAANAKEFVEQCEAAIAERSDAERIAARMQVAHENSWDARAHVIWEAVLALRESGGG